MSASHLDPVLPNSQPVYITLQSVPSTGLLHFTVVFNIVCGALGIAFWLLTSLGSVGDARYPSAPLGCLIFAVFSGLSLWWWIHCLVTLRKLREYSTQQLMLATLQRR